MNNGDFEKQLRGKPFRTIPQEWRMEILRAAHESAPATPSIKERLREWCQELFWPCPRAWAGVAAVWVLLVVINYVPAYETETRISAETRYAVREQFRLRAELISAMDSPVVAPQEEKPRPRSQKYKSTILA